MHINSHSLPILQDRKDINPRDPAIENAEDDEVQIVGPTAAVMATATTTTQKKRKAAPKKKQHHKDLQQAQEDAENAASDAVEIMKDGTTEKAKKKRAILRNQDLVAGIDAMQGEILKNGQVAKSMAASLEKALVASATSPSSKGLAKVSKVESHLSNLREERRRMMDRGDPQDEIDEITEEITEFSQMKRNLNKKLFDAAEN